MEVKLKKTFAQKVTIDSKLEGLTKSIKSPVKDKKFDEMVSRMGLQKLKTLTE